MGLQWTVVAIFLYAEIFVLSLFCLPWIRANIWKKIFGSRIVKGLEAYSQVFAYALGGILALLFMDAIREVRKYSFPTDEAMEAMISSPQSDTVINMRLFRAQRNLYISGFALFLWVLIRRMVNLITKEAQLTASVEAAVKQARGASQAAAAALDSQDAGDSGGEVKELKEKMSKLRKELELAVLDRDAMKKQSDNVKDEYDRVSAELANLQEGSNKKDD